MTDDRTVHKLGIRMSGRTWYNVRWDLTSAVLFSFFNVVFNQFYVPIAIQHGASGLQIGLLTAAPAIGLLLSPIWATMVENRKPKPFVVIPHLLARSLVLLPAFVPEPWMFVAAALSFHMLMGVAAPAYAALITQIYPPDLRGRLMGNVRVAMGVLMIPLAYLVGRWIDVSGVQGPLIAGVATGIVSVLALNRVREGGSPPPAAKTGKPAVWTDQFRPLKEHPQLSVFLAATTVSGFANMLASPIYQIVQVDKLNLTNVEIGYVRMTYYGCLLLAYLAAGWVIDKYSPKHAMYVGLAAFAANPLLYGAIGTYPAVVVAGGLQGMGDAIWDIGCLAYVFRIVPGREAVAFGLHLMLFGIRGSIGPLLGTALIEQLSIPVVLYAASVLGWLGFLMLFMEKSPGALRRVFRGGAEGRKKPHSY